MIFIWFTLLFNNKKAERKLPLGSMKAIIVCLTYFLMNFDGIILPSTVSIEI